MTEIIGRSNHNTFAGVINPGDFDVCTYMSDVASKIATAETFNKTCKRNYEGRARMATGRKVKNG